MNSLVPKPVRAEEEEEEEEEKPLTDPGGLSSFPSVRTRKTDDGATVFDKGGGHLKGYKRQMDSIKPSISRELKCNVSFSFIVTAAHSRGG